MLRVEFRKIATMKLLVIIVVGLFLNGLLLNYNVQEEYSNRRGGTTISIYKDIFSNMEGDTNEEKAGYLKKRLEKVTESTEYAAEEEDILTKLVEESDKIVGYEEYLNTIIEEARTKSAISIFAKKGTFSYRNVVKQAEDFESMHGTKVSMDISEGVLAATENSSTDFIVILILLFICGMVIINENVQGIMPVIKCTKKGRTRVILCKIGVVALISLLLSMLFMAENLIYASTVFGLGDLSRPMQSLSGYLPSTLPLTVLQYLLYLCAMKAMGFFLIGLLALLVCQIMKQPAVVYVIMAFVTLVNYVLYDVILAVSKWNVFKYINLRNYISGVDSFKAEQNINIFGFPAAIYVVTLVSIGVLVTVFVGLNLYVFSLKDFSGIKLNGKKFFHKNSFSNKIFGHELFKVLVTQKVFWVILIFAGARFYLQDTEVVYDYTEVYEKSYMEELSGKLTKRQDTYIEEQMDAAKRIQDKLEAYNEEYGEGKISLEELRIFQDTLYEKLMPYYAFEAKILPVYEHLKEKEEAGEDAYFIYPKGYHELFATGEESTDELDVARATLLLLFLIVCFSGIRNMEYETGMHGLLITCKNGRKKTVRAKVISSLLICTVLFLINYLPDLYFVMHNFGFDYATKSLNNLIAFAGWGSGWKIWHYIVVLYGVRLVTAWILTLVIQVISSKTRDNITAIFTGSVALLMPFIVHMLKVTILDKVSFLPLLGTNELLQGSVGQMVLYLVVAVAIAIGCIVFLEKEKQKII